MLNDLVKLAYAASQTPVMKTISAKLWGGKLDFTKADTNGLPRDKCVV